MQIFSVYFRYLYNCFIFLLFSIGYCNLIFKMSLTQIHFHYVLYLYSRHFLHAEHERATSNDVLDAGPLSDVLRGDMPPLSPSRPLTPPQMLKFKDRLNHFSSPSLQMHT